MKTKNLLTGAALAAALTIGVNAVETKADGHMEKCYGVSKAGKNDCQAHNHSCAGQATVDGDPQEWILMPKGLCERLVGGKLTKE